jgi:hypothetical protein
MPRLAQRAQGRLPRLRNISQLSSLAATGHLL